MRLNRGGHPEARAQVERLQIKYISIKGLKIPPQCTVCRKESKKQKILQSSGTREGDQLILLHHHL
jgi:hypothetical protein